MYCYCDHVCVCKFRNSAEAIIFFTVIYQHLMSVLIICKQCWQSCKTRARLLHAQYSTHGLKQFQAWMINDHAASVWTKMKGHLSKVRRPSFPLVSNTTRGPKIYSYYSILRHNAYVTKPLYDSHRETKFVGYIEIACKWHWAGSIPGWGASTS